MAIGQWLRRGPLMLILLSLSASAAVAFYYVLCIAVRTSHIAPPTGRIIVLGMRLDAAGEPAPDHRACLDCA